MSTFIYPFEINCRSINTYFQVIKNCFRMIEKNNLHLKIDGLILSLSYDINAKDYYININKKNLYLNNENFKYLNEKYNNAIILFRSILNEIKFLNALKTLKINKFSNRSITFIFLDGLIYPISLNTNSIVSNKNLLVLDDLFFYFSDLENIKSTNLNLDIKIKYNDLYKTFWEEIKLNTILNYDEHKTIESLNKLSLDEKCNKISFKKFQTLYESGLAISNKDIFYYLVYLITIKFNHFLNRHFGLGRLDFMFFDKESNRIIKIPSKMSNVISTKKTKEDFLPPLMPVRF